MIEPGINPPSDNPTIVDTHVHLDDLARVTSTDINQVVVDAMNKGVDKFIVPGLYPDQWQQIHQLETAFPGSVYCAFGIHPWWVAGLSDVGELSNYRQTLGEYFDKYNGIAVGETGLDRLKNQAYDHQLAFFEMHLSLAAELNKPIIIHCVRAHNDLQRLLKKYQGKVCGVIHGFSGSVDVALDYWKKGFYLGIGGTITYPRANKSRQAISALPLESLLLETDAPAMPIYGKQGSANRPETIFSIAEEIAALKNIDSSDVLKQSWVNAKLLFNV